MLRPPLRVSNLWLAPLLILISGCGSGLKTTYTQCNAVKSGTSWSPVVSGVSTSYHDATSSLSTTTSAVSGPVTGYAQAAGSAQEITTTFSVPSDLGAYGSFVLSASVTNYPAELRGVGYPHLVYLSDGTNDLINLTRAGSGGDCWQSGYYTSCSSSGCTRNSSCTLNWPSAYVTRAQWEDRQFAGAYMSVNTFPTCNWGTGSAPPSNYPACAFNSTFFPASPTPVRLRSGVTYTAKYVIIDIGDASLSGKTATLNLRVTRKTDTTTSLGGALDLNVVLVGNDNINSSRTTQGQRNLNTLFSSVVNMLAQTNAVLQVGRIDAYEWPCESGAENYVNVDAGSLGDLFQQGSSLLDPSSSGKAVNIFIVSSILNNFSGVSSGATILGVSGAIGGPPLHGTVLSGLAFSSFNLLGTYNPNCTSGTTCTLSTQQRDFVNMSGTIAHELGHYLGLNHPSESGGASHDAIYDTPICTAKDNSITPANTYITINSCLNTDVNSYPPTSKTCSVACGAYNSGTGVFCPTALECQFNHIMWYTNKNFKEGTSNGDGNLFSPNSGTILNYSPFVQ